MKNLESLDKDHLQKVLGDARDGKYIIPTFQREFSWEASDVLELIRSIFEDYYIGTLLFWKVSSENINSLKSEEIYGFTGKGNPNYFVLDGQQRLSAIYYSFCSPDINFPNRKNKCYFFIKLDKLLDEEFDEAFYYEWDSKRVKNLFEDKNQQFEDHIFPIKILGDKDIYLWTKWIDEYEEYWVLKGKTEFKETREKLYNIFKETLQDYKLSYIALDTELDLEKVCDIFTRLNDRGKPLTIFDILNAAFLPKGIELKEKWRGIDPSLPIKKPIKNLKIYLLQTISIMKQGYCSPKYLYYLVPGSKRKIKKDGIIVEKEMVSSSEEFENLWIEAIANINLTIDKLTNPREFGAIKPKFIPYPSIISAFTAINSESKNPEYGNISNRNEKISKWYWASIFTKKYSSSVESQATSDFNVMKKWFKDNNNEPPLITEAINEINNIDLKTEINQNSAIYNAIFNLMIINGARDPITFELPEYYSIDDHHIIPKKSELGKKLGNRVNTILNRIGISDDTNRNIFQTKLPNEYIKDIFKKSSNMDNIYDMFESHFISKEMIDILLRTPFEISDFEEFITARENLIKENIKKLFA